MRSLSVQNNTKGNKNNNNMLNVLDFVKLLKQKETAREEGKKHF